MDTQRLGRIPQAMSQAVSPARAEAHAGPCPVCDGEPRVLLVMRHPTMLRLTRDLLDREFGCWLRTEMQAGEMLAEILDRETPDLMIIDERDFPACCRDTLERYPRDRVIVIGPEPDPGYRAAAIANGAGAWLPRERVGDDLAGEMRRLLGCVHDPCPPGHRASRGPRHLASRLMAAPAPGGPPSD